MTLTVESLRIDGLLFLVYLPFRSQPNILFDCASVYLLVFSMYPVDLP